MGEAVVATRSRVVRACALLLLAACGEDSATTTQSLLAQSFALDVPQLGCFEKVKPRGSCARSSDCDEQQRCVHDRAASWQDREPVPLTCAPALGTRGMAARCSQGDECESGLCGLPGICLEPCSTSKDCGLGRVCRPIEARIDQDAMGPVMACARSLVLPEDVLISLGQNAGALSRGTSSLTVPGTGEPALIYVQADCSEDGFDLMKLFSSDLDRNLYDRTALQSGQRMENTILHDGSSLAALLFPANPTLPAAQLGLTLTLRSDSKQRAEVVVAARAKAPAGKLDLNVFYVGGGEELAGVGGFHPGERRVAEMLGRLDARLGAYGLSLGTIQEHDVVGALREELSVLEVPKNKVGERIVEGRPLRLDELFALSAGVDSAGINIFLVRDMSSYIGIAGGIPGVLGIHGTARSGVALATDVLGELLDADLVLLHELGHFLGLFHTTEASGVVLDPLPDTPECTLAQDADGDRELAAWECEGHGSENLMFWSGAGTLLTAQQISVLTSSVIFH